MNKKYYPFLDGLRGIAILSVVFSHGNALINSNNSFLLIFKKILTIGHLGVDMFFVISGFLITGILIDEWTTPIRLKRFYMRRSFKILPQYFFFIICGFILLIGRNEINAITILEDKDLFSRVLSYFLFYQNYTVLLSAFTHTWSLSIEEHFYLLYSLIVMLVFKLQKEPKRRHKTLIATIAISIILLWVDRTIGGGIDFLSRYLNTPKFSISTFFRIDALLFGCLLKLFEPYYSVKNKWLSARSPSLSFILASLIYIFLILTGFSIIWIDYILAYLASGLMLFSAYKGFKPLSIITENAIMCWIGRYSYGIYLWHWEVLNIHRQPFLESTYLFNNFISYLLFSIFIGYTTTKTIDNVFLKLRSRISP